MGCNPTKISPINSSKIPKNQDYANVSLPQKKDVHTKSFTEDEKKVLKNFTITPVNFIRRGSAFISDKYEIIGPSLGKGSFGEVKRAIHKLTKKIYAVKIISFSRFDLDQQRALMNEVNILRSLDHPYVIKIYEFFREKELFYIVSEFCSGGDLTTKIKGQMFGEKYIAKLMYQVFSGLNYLHKNGIVHRDIKPDNLLFDKPNGQIKICDFGISKTFKGQETIMKPYGTTKYMAPEVLKGKYDSKCDLWSCGVLFFILLSGFYPFYGKDEKEIEECILKGKYSLTAGNLEITSREAKNLLKNLLKYDPKKRFNAEQALNSDFFKKNMARKLDKKFTKLGQEILQNLSEHRTDKKFQDSVLVFMVSHFADEDEKKRLSEIFQEIDSNKDGLLTKEEILTASQNFGLKMFDSKNVEEIINRIDRNDNGTIDYSEFVIAACNKKKLLNKVNLENTFKMIDADKSNFISADELKEFFIGESDNKEDDGILWGLLIKEVNPSTENQIMFEDFVNIMTKILEK